MAGRTVYVTGESIVTSIYCSIACADGDAHRGDLRPMRMPTQYRGIVGHAVYLLCCHGCNLNLQDLIAERTSERRRK